MRKYWDKSPLSIRIDKKHLSQFGSNPSSSLDLRGIPQLMEPYPQLIPRIYKVVEPLKAYIRRNSHGEKGRIRNEKYCHFDCGSFEQGVGQGDLGEAATFASTLCKNLILLYMCLAYFLQVCVCLHRLVSS